MTDLRTSFFVTLFLALTLIFTACAQETVTHEELPAIEVDRELLLNDIETLASDEFGGRYPGTEGSVMVQDLIIERLESLGIQPKGEDFRHLFDHTNPRTGKEYKDAVNIIGWIEGTENPDQFIAVTAHYDHLGIQNGDIYNGADDNASGTGGLLATAAWFAERPPKNSILLIALDAEEQGLGGARHFVANPVVPLESIIMNINMDMISLNHDNEIYAVGTYHYPFLRPMIEKATVGAPITVLFGHDTPDLPPGQDWTYSSDHGAFHEKGIPFVYFGVADHPYYHTPDDIFENITPEFYYNAVRTIIHVIRHFDHNLDTVIENRELETSEVE